MPIADHIRCRPIPGPAVALAIGLAVVATMVAPGLRLLAVEPTDSPNRLDQPMADAAWVAPIHPDDPLRLLVIDAIDQQPNVATVRMLERTRAWESVAVSTIDFGAAGGAANWIGARWLVGLAPDRFALIGTTDTSERSIVVGLHIIDENGRRSAEETGRVVFERHIADAGAADVDGDGISELLLGLGAVHSDTCAGSELLVYDGSTLALSSTIRPANRLLGSGVIGPFDDLPGDELLAYADEECHDAVGSLLNVHLIGIRLVDGTTLLDMPSAPRYGHGALGPPLRIDLDGVAPDEAVALTVEGLSILDPGAGWASMPIGSDRAVPLAAGADADSAGPAVRLAWAEPSDGSIVAARYRRGPSGAIETSGAAALDASEDPGRWDLTQRAILDAAARGEPALGYLGDAVDAGCPDVIVPGGLLPCGADAFRTGAAWIGTRPIAAIGAGAKRRLLAAAGLAWDPGGSLPPSPSPWVSAPAGWWRHGPSVPFALSEMRASDTTYFREFPEPIATIEADTSPDVRTTIPGFTGTRLFVRAAAVTQDAQVPEGRRSALLVLGAGPDATALATVVRVPVPPGAESGRNGSFATLDLARVRMADGTAAARWMLDVVPLNDWGEIGDAERGVIGRDAIGPNLNVTTPFMSPIWPVAAQIRGSTDPGATVVVEGVGEMDLDRRGGFAIQTTLAPWPQTLRITATDESGNLTVRELSVVGGIDYRRFPWSFIAAVALLLLVAARGLFGDRRSGGPTSRSRRLAGWYDEGPRAEIEELPPGGGLAPR